jgi:arsenate reductase (glutaredoxin)
MIKVYGIKTCGSVRKALKYFKDNNIEIEYQDFRKDPVGQEKVDRWLQSVDIDTLMNKKGTKYRTLELKSLDLDANGKREWLIKENMLFKRPVIEVNENKTIVAFDEAIYETLFKG